MALYITITGQKHYFGLLPFVVGKMFSLVHEEENTFDAHSVAVYAPKYGKVGSVAQSPHTMADGTVSAEAILPLLAEHSRARISFIAGDYIIAEIC